MSAVAALLLAASGFALLALAMRRHAREAGIAPEWLGNDDRRRLSGTILLALSLIFLVTRPTWDFALVEWILVLAAAAGLVALGLWHWPQRMPRLALACGAGGAVLALALRLIGGGWA